MDKIIFKSLYNLTNFSPFFDGLIVFLAKTLPYLVFLYFLILIYKQSLKSSKKAINTTLFSLVAVAVSSGIVLPIIHFIAQKERPFVNLSIDPLFTPLRDSSMPSGHASFFILLATIALFKLDKKSAIWMYLCAALISISRVIAGVHWPSDILIGASIAIATVLILIPLESLLTKK